MWALKILPLILLLRDMRRLQAVLHAAIHIQKVNLPSESAAAIGRKKTKLVLVLN